MVNKLQRTLLMFGCLCVNLPVFAQKPTLIEQPVAFVGQDVILQSELAKYMQENSVSEDARAQALQQLIANYLQNQAAQNMGLTITNSQLEASIQNWARENNIDPAEYLAQEAEKYKTSISAIREQIRQELLFNLVRHRQIGSRITITDDEIQKLADTLAAQYQNQTEYQVAHFRLKSMSEAELATLKKDLTQKKQSFEQLAQHYGEQADTQAQAQWFKANEMPTFLLDAVAQAKQGQIVGPLQSPVGQHLVFLKAKKNDLVVEQTEYFARHILLKPSVLLSDEDAKQQLKNYRTQILGKKTTFAKLAEQHTEDLATQEAGGALGWMTPAALDPAFAQTMTALKPGKISQPVRSGFGWHLIMLDKVRTVDITDKALKHRAKEMLFAQRMNAEVTNWLETLRNESYVKIVDNTAP